MRTLKPENFSIGLYTMDCSSGRITLVPYPGVNNPVLTSRDVKENNVSFVADPFIVEERGKYYLFFEALINGKGSISVAESPDGISWKYGRIVLDEPFHLSYPCVFRWEGSYYMVPESSQDLSVRLYRATGFPYRWEFMKKIISGDSYSDSTIFEYRGRWWLFTTTNNSNLLLFCADNPLGPWTGHPMNPLIRNDSRYSRPGGNVLQLGNRIIRIAQDDLNSYGNSLHSFEILRLDRNFYKERIMREDPLLAASGKGWNKDGMHQLSVVSVPGKRSIAAVDGKKFSKMHVIYLTVPPLMDNVIAMFSKD